MGDTVPKNLIEVGVVVLVLNFILGVLKMLFEFLRSRNGAAQPTRSDIADLTNAVKDLGVATRESDMKLAINYPPNFYASNKEKIDDLHRVVTREHDGELDHIVETTASIHEILIRGSK